MIGSLARRAARHYVAGPRLQDALSTAAGLDQRHRACALGYWDSGDEPASQVRAEATAAATALRVTELDAYLSLKAPALDYDLGDLPHAGVRLHLDALLPESVGEHLRLATGLRIGMTLPARWRRSVADAAVLEGLPVRVVKGQFPDPGREQDPRTGLLAVVDALAGRASFVAVATHDGPLGVEALRRLRAAGTPCGLELLHGLPVPREELPQGTPVRVYVPYGEAFLPYAVRSLVSHPRTAAWVVRDLLLR